VESRQRRAAEVRPYVLLSCAISVDGYTDDASERRLVLSCADDLDRVDALRATCDAILVGAGTVRADDPRLLLRSQARRQGRIAAGLAADPIRVALSRSGALDPAAAIFTGEGARTIVYVASQAALRARERLGAVAEVVGAGDQAADLGRVLADLSDRGVARLLVEGGQAVRTQFLLAGLADELQLAIAPVIVGDSRAPRFAGDGAFAADAGQRAQLAEVRQVGDMVVARYQLSSRFDRADDHPERLG
jgi:5-amino-6-(5-phosphoribosylamino)uracil reductase